MREQLTAQGMNAYLDTTAGKAQVARYGSRQAAAAAMYAAERSDRDWRSERAETLAERYPSRYASVADAMRDVPAPIGPGVYLEGSSDDVIRALRRADPIGKWRNLGIEDADGSVAGAAVGPDGTVTPADTRPPWQR